MAGIGESWHQSDQWYTAKRIEVIEKAEKQKEITEADARMIRDFIGTKASKICSHQSLKYAYILINWRRYFINVSYSKICLRDVNEGIEKMRQHGYKLNTQRDYTSFLKRFVLWLIDRKLCGIKKHSDDHGEIQKISPGKKDKMTRTQNDLYTKEEVKDLLQAAPVMYKTIIAILYDGALRPKEFGTLTWGQVKEYEHKAVINVNIKTGKPRKIPLYTSYSYLKLWKNQYPGEINPEAPVFLNDRGRCLTWACANSKIKAIAKEAHLKRAAKMYNFRHTKITDMRRASLGDGIISKIAWGSEKSEMLSTYSHLSDDDTDLAIAEYEGIKVPGVKKRERALEASQCQTCFAICGPTMSYCPECGNPLTKEATDELRAKKEWFESQPEILEVKAQLKALEDTLKKMEKQK